MSSDWKQAVLGDFIKIKHGYPFKSEFFIDQDNGQILLTPGNFNIKGGLKLEKLKFYQGPIDIDYILSPEVIIVSMTDLSKESDTLGYPARIPKSSYIYLHNQRLGKVIFKNDKINPTFLYYLLCSPSYRNEILASSSGTSVKHTAPSRIEAFKTYLPSLNEQKAIANLLSSLDDKIELNRQMCKALEDIASTLFKSWFIDFDPVKAKAAGRKPESLSPEIADLFPDSFVESIIGPVPKEWSVKPISSVIEVNPKRQLKKGCPSTYLDMSNISTHSSRAKSWITRNFTSGTCFKNGDTLLARITPCLENGKTCYVDFLNEDEIGWGSTEYIILCPKQPLPKEYAYLLAVGNSSTLIILPTRMSTLTKSSCEII